jgi:hypothetical protein
MKRRRQWTAGQRLNALYELRLKGDYDLDAEISDLRVDEAFEHVNYISAALASAWQRLPP